MDYLIGKKKTLRKALFSCLLFSKRGDKTKVVLEIKEINKKFSKKSTTLYTLSLVVSRRDLSTN